MDEDCPFSQLKRAMFQFQNLFSEETVIKKWVSKLSVVALLFASLSNMNVFHLNSA